MSERVLNLRTADIFRRKCSIRKKGEEQTDGAGGPGNSTEQISLVSHLTSCQAARSIQGFVKTFLLSSENDLKNVLLLAPKSHYMYGNIFWPAIPRTCQEYFYTTLFRDGQISYVNSPLQPERPKRGITQPRPTFFTIPTVRGSNFTSSAWRPRFSLFPRDSKSPQKVPPSENAFT